MTIAVPNKRSQPSPQDLGPRVAFLVSMIGVAVAWAAASRILPDVLVIPAVSTLLFVLAGIFALVAWVRCTTDEYHVSYWDVSGAIVLIGIGTAALIDPEPLARLVANTHTQN